MTSRADTGKESPPARRTYSRPEAERDQEYYGRLKRKTVLGTAVIIALVAATVAVAHPGFGFTLAVGGAAGIGNTLSSMYGNERLLDRRSVAVFVLSSFVRIWLFGIVPVVLALRIPTLWTLGWYFAGFFTPLALGAALLHRREAKLGS